MLERSSPEPTSSPALIVAEADEDTDGLNLREGLNFVWRQWKFIGSIVGLSLLVAVVYLVKQTPHYTADALVLLEAQPQRSPVAIGDALVDLSVPEMASQIAIIESVTFLRRVVQRVKLVNDPEFGSPLKSKPRPRSLLATIKSYFVQPNASGTNSNRLAPEVGAIPIRELSSIRALRGAISVKRAGAGYVLSIAVTSIDPEKAAKLANAVANAYIVQKLDARFDAAKRASGWLSDRLAGLRKQVRESEDAVAKFRADHGLTESAPNVALTQEQLSQLSAKLVQARTDLAQKKARLDVLRSIIDKGGSIQSLPDLPDSSMLKSLRAQEVAISQKEADLESRYSARHPLVVNIRAQHRDIQRQISAELRRVAGNVSNEYELAKARVAALEDSLKQATGQGGGDDKLAVTLHELERTAAVNSSLFDNFLQKAKITQQEATFEAQAARVITPAMPPGAPSSPQKLHTMMVAVAMGLVLGIGGAFAREKLNSGFMTPGQVETMLDLPLLVSASKVTGSDLVSNGTTVQIPLLPVVAPLSRFSEAIRTLRSGIHMTDVDDPPKILQITSTVPGEGKTTIGLSLAASAAASGQKVLFIDTDLRHPAATKFLGLQKEHGIVDVLLGKSKIGEALRYDETLKLWKLGAGSKTQSPTDLLGSERMKLLFEQFRNSFELIVVDTPPIGPVIDPVIVSQIADKVIFVVRWGSTSREAVQQSVRRIHGHRKVAGIVFNFVDGKLAKKYGKDADSYYYGARQYEKYYSSGG